ncbi:MAG: C25 family cysteine peptidase, partial [Nitrospira sp.]|nr:C25 family cysteine peptidase [Nitrospira sp.]
EQKNYPEVSMHQDVREHWFWGEVFYTPGLVGTNAADIKYYQRDYYFSTRNIDKTKPVLLKLRLQSVNGSHHVRGYINGSNNIIVDEIWDSEKPYDIEVSVPVSYLNNGQNTFRLESVGDTSSGIFESFYLDWFDVSFYHIYQAEHDSLEFTGNGLINISYFTSRDISIYDISSYPDIKILTLPPDSIEDTGAGYKKAVFSTPDIKDSNFIALASSEKQKPLSVEAYTSADLRSKDGDYIIITHENFYDVVKPLADYRSSQGYKVLTVKMGDIYNEFNSGIETPQAIKDFLAYAYYNWTTKPKYVLLVGDATIDYKDVSGYGKNNGVRSYVPAYLYNYPGLGEVPSDNWFADVDVDDKNGILPEMNIGRIPAKTPADVTAVITKISAHESFSLSNNVLLVADVEKDNIQNPLPADQQIFNELSDSISTIIPDNYNKKKLYKDNDPVNFKNNLINAIDSGALVINYSGHGAVDRWTQDEPERIFSSQDMNSLKKNNQYPFVVALNCLNGYFVLPNDGVTAQDGGIQYPSIAESFLLAPEKGAVAVFAASSIGYPSEHGPLATALYGAVFEEGITLGDAVTKAKEIAYDNGTGVSKDVVQTFIFFGDPATRLK